MRNGEDWGQPGQYPQEGYGQPWPQELPWEPQNYDPAAHRRRLGGQQYAPQGHPWPRPGVERPPYRGDQPPQGPFAWQPAYGSPPSRQPQFTRGRQQSHRRQKRRTARNVLAVIGALVVVLIGVGVAVNSGRPASTATPGVTVVARGVWVQGAGAVHVTSIPEPQAADSLEKPISVGGRRLPSALTVLATPRHLESSGPLPVGGVVLSFQVDKQRVAAGTAPFLASLDTVTGLWVPVPSSYDPADGVVSARVPHFSTWAPVQWVASGVAAVFEGITSAFFGLGGVGVSPSCSGQTVTVTDSRPGRGIGACAAVSGTDRVAAKIVNERPYAVDLLYPAAAQVTVPAGDAFAELGADLTRLASNWHRQLLLPGGGEADATVAMSAGQQAEFVTQWDDQAYLWGILGTAIRTLATMTGGTAMNLVDALGASSCLSDVVNLATNTSGLSLATAEEIGSAAFDCLSAVATGLAATVASIIASLDVELVSSVYSAIDNLAGDASHDLTLAAPSPRTSSSSTGSAGNSATPQITIFGGVSFPLFPVASFCNNSEPFYVLTSIGSNLTTTVTYYWTGTPPSGETVNYAPQTVHVAAGQYVQVTHNVSRTGYIDSNDQEDEGNWTIHITAPVSKSATYDGVYLDCRLA
jgi:hypothetical protein